MRNYTRGGDKDYWAYSWKIASLKPDKIALDIDFRKKPKISPLDTLKVTFMFEDFDSGMKNYT